MPAGRGNPTTTLSRLKEQTNHIGGKIPRHDVDCGAVEGIPCFKQSIYQVLLPVVLRLCLNGQCTPLVHLPRPLVIASCMSAQLEKGSAHPSTTLLLPAVTQLDWALATSNPTCYCLLCLLTAVFITHVRMPYIRCRLVHCLPV